MPEGVAKKTSVLCSQGGNLGHPGAELYANFSRSFEGAETVGGCGFSLKEKDFDSDHNC